MSTKWVNRLSLYNLQRCKTAKITSNTRYLNLVTNDFIYHDNDNYTFHALHGDGNVLYPIAIPYINNCLLFSEVDNVHSFYDLIKNKPEIYAIVEECRYDINIILEIIHSNNLDLLKQLYDLDSLKPLFTNELYNMIQYWKIKNEILLFLNGIIPIDENLLFQINKAYGIVEILLKCKLPYDLDSILKRSLKNNTYSLAKDFMKYLNLDTEQYIDNVFDRGDLTNYDLEILKENVEPPDMGGPCPSWYNDTYGDY